MNIFYSCYFILLLHYITEGIIVVFTVLHLSNSFSLPYSYWLLVYKTYTELIKYDALF